MTLMEANPRAARISSFGAVESLLLLQLQLQLRMPSRERCKA